MSSQPSSANIPRPQGRPSYPQGPFAQPLQSAAQQQSLPLRQPQSQHTWTTGNQQYQNYVQNWQAEDNRKPQQNHAPRQAAVAAKITKQKELEAKFEQLNNYESDDSSSLEEDDDAEEEDSPSFESGEGEADTDNDEEDRDESVQQGKSANGEYTQSGSCHMACLCMQPPEVRTRAGA